MEIKTDFLDYFHHRKKIVMHTQKNRVGFAIDCKSSGFSKPREKFI